MDERTSGLVTQVQDKLDDIQPCKTAFSGAEQAYSDEDITEIVGRWTAYRDVIFGSVGLLTNEEQDLLRIFFEEQSGLLR